MGGGAGGFLRTRLEGFILHGLGHAPQFVLGFGVSAFELQVFRLQGL